MASILPLVWLGRKLTGLTGGRRSVAIEQATALTLAEIKITPLVNPLLTWVLDCEGRILTRRYRLPFGTSLLALAKRH
jgi:hypothetical protein